VFVFVASQRLVYKHWIRSSTLSFTTASLADDYGRHTSASHRIIHSFYSN